MTLFFVMSFMKLLRSLNAVELVNEAFDKQGVTIKQGTA